MPKVRFISRRVVDDFRKGTPDEEVFEQDSEHDLGEASALLWVSAGVAEFVAADEGTLKPLKKKA
jgi:hypothetical protein